MAGAFFNSSEFVWKTEEHSNCHAVVDGSNMMHQIYEAYHSFSHIPLYASRVETFFQQFVRAGITVHVFMDGPSNCNTLKDIRSLGRRQDRLESLTNASGKRMRIVKPTSLQQVFCRVVKSLDIQIIQVSHKRDYLFEIVTHAKYLNAFVVSMNNRFFTEDLERGFVWCDGQIKQTSCRTRSFIARTFHYKTLCQTMRFSVGMAFIQDKYANPYALVMWRTTLANPNTFKGFVELFKYQKDRKSPRPEFYPQNSAELLSIFQNSRTTLWILKLLQFFLEHDQTEATRIVSQTISIVDRRQACQLYRDSIAADGQKPHDVFKRISDEIESGTYCDRNVPQWFLRYITTECKLLPGVFDILMSRRHYLIVFLEDLNRESANKVTLRLRRIVYGILFADAEDDEVIITELDRVGCNLEELEVRPIWKVFNPHSAVEPLRVPALNDMETLSQPERFTLFLSSMGVEEEFLQKVHSKKGWYIFVLFKYAVAAAGFTKKNLLTIFLAIVAVENQFSLESCLFKKFVNLKEEAYEVLDIVRDPFESVSHEQDFSCMHEFSQIQDILYFSSSLHCLFMEPLGETCSNIDRIFSEFIFYKIYKFTSSSDVDELVKNLTNLMEDDGSWESFTETLDLIWDVDDIKRTSLLLGSIYGEDERF